MIESTGSDDTARRALELAGVGVATIRADDGAVRFDRLAQSIFGLAPVYSFKEAARLLERKSLVFFRALIARGEGVQTLSLNPVDGISRNARVCVGCTQGAEILLSLSDVTEATAERSHLAQQVEHLWHTVEFNPQLPWYGDASGRIIGCTDRWLSLTGLTLEEAMGYDGWEKVSHPEDIGSVQKAVQVSMGNGLPLDVRFRVRVKSGEFRWMRAQAFPKRSPEGEVLLWYGYTEDIHELVLVEKTMKWNADHDSLTHLPNRAMFNRSLEDAIGEGLRDFNRVGLLLIDVDNFKDVNDVMGHDAGDALLIGFADLLRTVLPKNIGIARIGGDEFAVLIRGPAEEVHLDALCESVFAALRGPININGRSVECRCSIGGAVYPLHGQSPSELFKNADIALYEAKAHGRGRFTMFGLEMKQLTQRRVAMINLGREAVESGSIIPYYQIQISLADNRPVGFEALLRRRDRHGRICAPASIQAAFEDSEVAESLGDAMLTAVLNDITVAQDTGIDLDTVAINFSTAEFKSNSFVERLTRKMQDARVRYDQIAIEVTEGVFLGRQADKAAETIIELDRLGFQIALDDFGTGYASLLHLRQIPVDSLKIDQSFIRGLTENQDDLAIVEAIINLGASLGLDVIAEGIETEDQLALLRKLGLKLGQGFLFSRPLPFDDACALLRTYNADPEEGLLRASKQGG